MGKRLYYFAIGAAALLAGACQGPGEKEAPLSHLYQDSALVVQADSLPEGPAKVIILERDVKIKAYFAFLDSIIACEGPLLPYPLTEHLLVRANPWIIDSLANTDYYRLMARDSFVYDQEEMTILRRGDSLILPGFWQAQALTARINNTLIDINIPEYTLRIIESGDTLYRFPARVGRNQRKYLALAGATVDLRTLPGKGKIVRIARYPIFLDPATGRRFTHTRRDDGRTTLMPLIPWIEPEIDGHRYGQLIHPTTNPRTLGKAYSNGCIGVKEADAWYIYYHAPVGTNIHIHYQLAVQDESGKLVELKDIYNWKGRHREKTEKAMGPEEASRKIVTGCVCDEENEGQ